MFNVATFTKCARYCGILNLTSPVHFGYKPIFATHSKVIKIEMKKYLDLMVYNL